MDDIVTRLRNNFATKDYPMLKDHCHCCAIPKEWGGHHDNCLYDQAADEIEHLRKDRDKWRDIATELAIQNAIEYFCTPKQILDEKWDLIQSYGLTDFEKEVRGD